ncbi:MAG TPA: TylF/MycF/NovP-related O-methyltransferase, partial [Thermoleophilaceae bacterium]|nr:TylF/MycF/NovP-related O-methyltransferase [Thermoleophilaceae bacterium]
MRDGTERATRRYIELLGDALLDEHYLENELRIDELLGHAQREGAPELHKLANPVRYMSTAMRRLRWERDTGALPDDPAGTGGLAYAGLGRVRLEHLGSCLEELRAGSVAGDFVDCCTGRGGAAIFMRGFLEARELSEPRVWVADRFDGSGPRFAPDLNGVREAFARFRLLDERVMFLEGPPSRTLAEAAIGEIALLRIDSRGPEEIRSVLEALYPRVAPGGFVIVDGYGAPGCDAAVDEFRSAAAAGEQLERVDWSAVTWRKAGASPNGAVHTTRPAATLDLSVVLVMYNMRR